MVKRIIKSFVRFLLIIVLSGAMLIAILHNNKIQSFLAKVSSAYLTDVLGVNVWIEKISITSYFQVLLENVQVQDHKNQPMITAKTIQAKYNIFRPYVSEIPVNSLKIDSAFVNLVYYLGDSDMNLTMLFSDTSSVISDQENDTLPHEPFRLKLDYLNLSRAHFVYHVEKENESEIQGMNYEYLDITDINLEFENVHIADDSIAAHIISLRAKEKCGVVLNHLETDAIVCSQNIILTNASIITPRSNASLDLTFSYGSWSSYLDFINEVTIDADIRSSHVNMEDIAFFAPDMMGMDNEIRLQGKVSGPIRNMKGKQMRLSYGESTSFNGSLQMSGLPEIYETFINLKADDFSSSLSDIRSFNLPGGDHIDMIPQELEKLGRLRLKGRFTGFYNDFVSNSEIYTEIGRLKTDIKFTNNQNEDIIYYDGKFEASNFDVGQFLEMESEFGAINFDLDVNGKGLDLATLETEVKGRIDHFEFRNNELNTIFINAFVKENQFNGSLDIQDNLINTQFVGNINFDTINPSFDFVASFKDVKLAKLGLIDVDSSANLSTKVHMNFTGGDLDTFIGSISVDSTSFNYKGEYYFMDSLHIKSQELIGLERTKSLSISSDYLNGGLTGNYYLHQLPQYAEQLVQRFISQVDFFEEDDPLLPQNFQFNFQIDNSRDLTELFVPELVSKERIDISGKINTKEKKLDFDLTTNFIKFNQLGFDHPHITLNSASNIAHSNIFIDELILKEETKSDSLRLGIDSLNIAFLFKKDSLQFDIAWNNETSIPKNKGDINGLVKFFKEDGFELGFNHAKMVVNDSLWIINNQGTFSYYNNDIKFDSIQFVSNNQGLSLNGAISRFPDRSLDVRFDNFNVSSFDILTQQYGINLNGFLTGDFHLIDVYDHINFLVDLQLEKFNLNGEDLGRAQIKSTWNTDQSIFLNIDLEKKGNKGAYKPLYLEGYYYPDLADEQLDMEVYLNNISINFLDPFLSDFVSNLEGFATGKVFIKGNLNKPDLKGKIDLARTQFRIIYLNTLYSLSGTLNLDNNILGFNQVTLYDTLGNKAELTGGLTHQRLKNFGVDLDVQPDNFIALNTQKGMNDLFYGKAIITGNVKINGPFDNIFLDINATSKNGTDISIPINTTLGVSENNFIVFVNTKDSLLSITDKQYKPQLSSFSLNMDLSLTPAAKVEISLPSQLGSINAEGYGDLNMNLSRTGNFRMSGDYRVSKGLFFFKIRNLLNRKFVLNEGGTISWTGDPYSGTLGMSAKYQLKTSLNSLGLDQDSSYRNRVPVDCIIGLTGPIMNPNVKFRFEFPNATEEVKQYVFTKIDTTNPSEMSQQMLSLLVLNSFSFNNSNSNGNIANSVSGSSMQIVANQLSNWLSQISKDVDIGINYRPGGTLSNEEVEVALSTQLFDERVTIDGNFGYQNVQNSSTSNTSSIVGDINVEYKLTKDGRLRLKAFNRTNTVDLMDNTSPYTQGVGIFYRKEFNQLIELFQSKKRKEKNREEEMKKNQEAVLDEGNTTSSSKQKSN